jgi:uncharacterized protein (DUF2141 family)
MRLISTLILAMSLAPVVAQAGDLTVSVTEVQNGQGAVLAALYRADATFMDQARAVARLRVKAQPGRVTAVIHNLPAGRYALSVFHDANGNGKLDRNSMGIPSEGYGFSNDAQGTAGPPTAAQAAFDFDGKAKAITLSLNN